MKVTGFQPNFIAANDKSDNLLKQLASGKRINSAADDAAGLAIINRLQSELDGQLRGSQNGQDGISLAQTADAAFSDIGDSTARIRELSIQAGNGILSSSDRQAIQTEISGLTDHINEVAGNTTFGGVGLLNNNGSIGITLGGQSTIDVATKDAATDLNGLGLNAIDVTTAAGAQSALGVLDDVTDYIGANRGELGATQNRIGSGLRNLSNQRVQLADAQSRIADADFAQLTSERAKNDILQQSQLAIQGQSNLSRQNALSLLS